MEQRPLSILVYVGDDRIGDALLKLPVILGLRQAVPDARICWLTGKTNTAFKGVLKDLVIDQLDEVIEAEGIGKDYSRLIFRPLAEQSFDIVIDTQKSVRTALILKRIRHRKFISPAGAYFFSDVKPDNKKSPASIREKLLQLFSLALGKRVTAIDQLPIPNAARDAATVLLAAGKKYFGIAPGAGGVRKIWPLDRYITLANLQREKGLTPVFFIGPDEKNWVNKIRTEVNEVVIPEIDNHTDYPSSPLLSIALAERLTIGVSNDAGAGHILAAGGQPLITLFGPTNSSKFTDTSKNRSVIEAQQFGGTDINLIPLEYVDQQIDLRLAQQ